MGVKDQDTKSEGIKCDNRGDVSNMMKAEKTTNGNSTGCKSKYAKVWTSPCFLQTTTKLGAPDRALKITEAYSELKLT